MGSVSCLRGGLTMKYLTVNGMPTRVLRAIKLRVVDCVDSLLGGRDAKASYFLERVLV